MNENFLRAAFAVPIIFYHRSKPPSSSAKLELCLTLELRSTLDAHDATKWQVYVLAAPLLATIVNRKEESSTASSE